MPALWRGVLQVLAWLVPLGVLIQAGAAAPTVLFIRGALALHGALSFLVMGCALGVVIFAWALRLRWASITLAAVSFLALVGQTILGYATRGADIADHDPVGADEGLAVIHVAAGMFLLVLTLAVAFKLTRDLRLQRLAEEWTEGDLDLRE